MSAIVAPKSDGKQWALQIVFVPDLRRGAAFLPTAVACSSSSLLPAPFMISVLECTCRPLLGFYLLLGGVCRVAVSCSLRSHRHGVDSVDLNERQGVKEQAERCASERSAQTVGGRVKVTRASSSSRHLLLRDTLAALPCGGQTRIAHSPNVFRGIKSGFVVLLRLARTVLLRSWRRVACD
jgi:hypothetical protein